MHSRESEEGGGGMYLWSPISQICSQVQILGNVGSNTLDRAVKIPTAPQIGPVALKIVCGLGPKIGGDL
jgi:hypothetical protein